MAFTLLKNNFTGGEWSPLLEGRSDLEGYRSACRRMENMRPMVHGGAVMRGGLEFIAEARTGSKPVRLIAFNYSTNTRYVIEAGDKYFRIRRGHDASIAANSIATPYKAEDVFELQFKQVNDWMYIVHPEYAPRKLMRNTDTNWTLEEVLWDYAPLRTENLNQAVKLKFENNQLSAQGDNVFTSGHVGSYFEVRNFVEGAELELKLWPAAQHTTFLSSAILVRGEWDFTTSEFWWGTVYLERNRDINSGGVGPNGWEVIRKWSGQSDRNVSTSGKLDDEDGAVWLRIRYSSKGNPYYDPAMGNIPNSNMPERWKESFARITTKDTWTKGLVRVTGYNSPTSVNAVVVGNNVPVSAEWTQRWSEGAWSAHRGFPTAVGFFEQRMFYAGNRAQPQRVWGSRSGDFENFRMGVADNHAVAFDIAATEANPILWLDGMQRIILGTSGGEFTMSGAASGDKPLTGTSVSIRGQSAYGSAWHSPVRANDALIFVQRQGTKLRELVFSLERDGMLAPDLTVTAEHLFRAYGVQDLGFVRWPDPSIAVALGDCLGWLTYDKEAGMQAWAKYTSHNAIFESVCGIYGEPDEIWCVVRRKVGNTWKRFIERFAPEATTKAEARYLDCHKSGTLDYNWNGGVFTSGGVINGEVVRLYLGGVVVGDYTVIGGGIHVPDKLRDQIKAKWAKAEADHGSGASIPMRSYCVGFPYKGVIETMRLEIDGEQGSTAGKVRRIHKLALRFQNTGQGVRYGQPDGRMEELIFRDAVDPTDGTPPLFTGEKVTQFPLGYDCDARVRVEQTSPLPFMLLGLAVTAEITGG